jgi:stage IV sporulation protein FB
MGTRTFLGPSFFLLPLLFILPDITSGDLSAALSTAFMISAAFMSITLHEYGHIWMARKLGVKTGDITLHLFGGVADMEGDMKTGRNEVLIALAGPAVNIVILSIVLPITLWMRGQGIVSGLTYDALFGFTAINIFLVIFNMLPLFPMDGGRAVRGALRDRIGHLEATEFATKLSFVSAAFLCLVAYWLSNPLIAVLAVIMVFAGRGELKDLRARKGSPLHT